VARRLFPCCGAVFTPSLLPLSLLTVPVVAMPRLDALPARRRLLVKLRRNNSYCLSSHRSECDCVCALTNRIVVIVRSSTHVIILHTMLASPFICNVFPICQSLGMVLHSATYVPHFPGHVLSFDPKNFRKGRVVDTFAKLGRAIIIFVMTVRLSIRMEQLGSH
jgi:hypothetical protein